VVAVSLDRPRGAKNRAALKLQQLFPEKLKTETLLEAQQA
jgi:hypothetical protein